MLSLSQLSLVGHLQLKIDRQLAIALKRLLAGTRQRITRVDAAALPTSPT